MAKVYKVVTARLQSASVAYLPIGLVVDYQVGVPVKAPVGKLFAFENIEDAERFVEIGLRLYEIGLRIYEAECGQFYPVTTKIPSAGWFDEITRWWKGMLSAGTREAPKGTVVCDYIILGRQV